MEQSKTFDINRIESFHDFMETLNWHSIISDLTLYRGQANAEWQLEPRIVRNNIAESFDKSETDIINEFKRLGRSMLSHDILSNDWDLLAFAQHHGLRTRLLDWTTNPLIALWFTFWDDIDVEDRALWVLYLSDKDIADTDKGSPFTQQRTLAFKPNHVTQRITAQSGWFTTHKYVEGKEKFIPLEHNKSYKMKLEKLVFSNLLRIQFLERLDKLGINALSVFPDLNGLTQYLNWRRWK